MTVKQRFVMLIALCGVAIALPAGLEAKRSWDEMRFAQGEQAGLGLVDALLQATRLVQQHRGLSAVWLGGKEDQAAARATKAAEVDKALVAYQALVDANDAGHASVGKAFVRTRDGWKTLQDEVSGKRLDGPASSARHTALIALMIGVLDHTLEQWNLMLDPNPDTHLMVIGALQEAPRMVEIMGQMRARGANLLSTGANATPAARAAYGQLAEGLKQQFSRVTSNVERSLVRRGASGGQGSQDEAIRQAAKALADLGDRGIAYAQQHVVQPEALTHSSATFFTEMTRIIDDMYVAQGRLAATIAADINARAAGLRVRLALTVLAVLVLFGGAIGVAAHTGLWLHRRLGAEPEELAEAASQVARGELGQALAVRGGDNGSVMAAMSRMQAGLAGVVGGVRENAAQVATASGEIAQGNQDLSSRTESQASALEQTAASMEQLRTTIAHSADNARQASQLASQASDVASRGGAAVGELAVTMQRIQQSSQRIADIIATIDGIAFQTNILALNAAVEAARAGEQGRGFAVVASEVRALAQRSAGAAREIRTLITDSVERVAEGGRQGTEAAATMQEVVQAIRRVSDLIGEVSAAAQEQNSGVRQVSDAVTQMDQATQQNAALVEQSAAAAESLRQQADALMRAVSAFRIAAA